MKVTRMDRVKRHGYVCGLVIVLAIMALVFIAGVGSVLFQMTHPASTDKFESYAIFVAGSYTALQSLWVMSRTGYLLRKAFK
jgi:hypothetical protein